jgi:uncharacterized damage-inducible protein DinB
MAMMPPDVLRDLFQHMEWADAAVWRAVLAHDAARTDARLCDLLRHLHTVQTIFLLVWRDEPLMPTIQSLSTITDAAALQQRAMAYYPEARRFVESVDPASMTRGITMPFLADMEKQLGKTFAVPTLAETMFQVTSHSTYHRGQVNARLREVGGEPPLVDYIAWLWFGRPAPDWTAPAVSA